MSPIGSSPSPIDKIPDDIKLVILKCLGPIDATVTSKMDKIWQQFANKPIFWSIAAKQLNITVDQKNPKQGVLEYLQYHPINEAFKNLVVKEEFTKDHPAQTFFHGNTEVEKYQALVGHLKSFQNTGSPFLIYLEQLFEKEEPTPSQLRIVKKLIEDDVIQGDSDFLRALNFTSEHNSEIFGLIVNKAKAHPQFNFIIQEVLKAIADEGPSITPALQILLRHGAIPDENVLVNTLLDIHKPDETSHLKLLLDYSTDEVRQKAINLLNEKEKREKELEGDELFEIIEKAFSNHRLQIKNAPPPTFGKRNGKNSFE